MNDLIDKVTICWEARPQTVLLNQIDDRVGVSPAEWNAWLLRMEQAIGRLKKEREKHDV